MKCRPDDVRELCHRGALGSAPRHQKTVWLRDACRLTRQGAATWPVQCFLLRSPCVRALPPAANVLSPRHRTFCDCPLAQLTHPFPHEHAEPLSTMFAALANNMCPRGPAVKFLVCPMGFANARRLVRALPMHPPAPVTTPHRVVDRHRTQLYRH